MKRRSLGQHYLRDEGIVKRVIELAAIRKRERVLEVGTGRGTLTAELAKVADRLEAYEIDRENYLTTKSLLNSPHTKLRLGDAFKARPRFVAERTRIRPGDSHPSGRFREEDNCKPRGPELSSRLRHRTTLSRRLAQEPSTKARVRTSPACEFADRRLC